MEDKKWLAKSGSNILGPYTKKEVEECLNKGVLRPLDEITEPFSIYRPLRDHPEFKALARKIQSQSHPPLRRVFDGAVSKIITITQSTETLKKSPAQASKAPPPQHVQDAVFQSIPDSSSAKEAKETKGFESKPEHRLRMERKIKRTVRLFYIITLTGAAMVISWIAYREWILSSQKKQRSLNIRHKGAIAYKEGRMEEALPLLIQAERRRALPAEDKILLAGLWIKNRETEKAVEILKSLPEDLFNSRKALSLNGLAHLIEKNFPAAESFFEAAQKLSVGAEERNEGLFHQALLRYFQKDFTQALHLTQQLQNNGYQRGAVLYLNVLADLAADHVPQDRVPQDRVLQDRVPPDRSAPDRVPPDRSAADRSAADLNEAGKEKLLSEKVLDFAKRQAEYRQEFYVLMAFLNRKSRKEKEAWIQKALNEDPYFRKEYGYPPWTGACLVGFPDILPLCKTLFENSESALLNGFYGMCLLLSGQKGHAVYMEAAQKQAPKNPLMTSLYAFSFMEKGGLARAETLLDMAQDMGSRHTLPLILRAHIYISLKEWEKAEPVLENLLNRDPLHVSGYGALALVRFHLKRREGYLAAKEKALRLYPHYQRLLSLRNDISKESGRETEIY